MSRRQEDALDEILVHPRFELTHPMAISIVAGVGGDLYLPKGGLGRVGARSRGRGNAAHVRGGRSAVGVGHRARRGTVVGGHTRETRVHIHDELYESQRWMSSRIIVVR